MARSAGEMKPALCSLLLLVIAVALLSCASNRQVGLSEGEVSDPPARIEETVTSEPELDVHRGTLAKTVEEGGWLLKTTGQEYLLLSIFPTGRSPGFEKERTWKSRVAK